MTHEANPKEQLVHEHQIVELRHRIAELEALEAERSRGEEALRAAKEYAENLINSSLDMIISVDLNRNITEFNRAAEEAFGYAKEEVLGRPVGLLYADPGEGSHAHVGTLKEGQFKGEITNKRKNGEIFYSYLSAAVMLDAQGKAVGVMGISRDITQRKRAEAALQKVHQALEQRVEERTAALRTINESLQHEIVERKQAEASLQFTQFAIDRAGDAAFWLDSHARFFYVNDAACRSLGYSHEELLSMTVHDIDPWFPAETWADHWSEIRQRRSYTFESSHRTKDGRIFPVEITVNYLEFGGKEYHCAFARDITERKGVEAALRDSEERYRALYEDNPAMYFTVDPRGTVLSVNQFGAEQLGYKVEELVGQSVLRVLYEEDQEAGLKQLTTCLQNPGRVVYGEFRKIRKDGSRVWVREVVRAVQGTDGNIVILIVCEDITERKRAEEQLLHDAFHDRLTGLPNRALFMDQLGRSLRHTKRRDDYLIAVLLLDLDHFKIINDSLGHLIGDHLLIAIARRLENSLRVTDMVARLGGDEFAILLEDIKDISEATFVTDRIQRTLTLPFNLDGHEVFTTASIGIALSATGYDRSEDLLRNADTAMYRAKAHGRARHEVFDRAMHDRAVARLQLETDLRRAIERKEFQLYYQPIVLLETGRIVGFETLVRWQHLRRGFVAPAEFIPVAEETGLIIPINRWMLREACRQMRTWQSQFPVSPPLTMSMNLSGKQFTQSDLIEQIDEILQETGLEASSLKLEITESAIIEYAEAATVMISQLRSRGIHLCLDDFGTGYSSLSYLHHFPIEMLKIDRSFVKQMDGGGDHIEIVRAIVTLAHNLGIAVVAEGVETAEQLAQLRALECTYGQGYLFSEPVDSEAMAALMERYGGRIPVEHVRVSRK